MSHSLHTTTMQSCDLESSLLNTSFVPATGPTAARNPRNREKIHPCTWQGCGRYFDCPHNVQQHVREAHTLERPYECEECAAEGTFASFSRQFGLNRHKRQVHSFGGAQSSKAVSGSGAGNVGAAAVPQWTHQSQGSENSEFADMGALLSQANVGMGAVFSDFEMFDEPFHFDAEMSDFDVSGLQNSSSHACGDCGFAAAKKEDILLHIHAIHQAPNSRFCACNICAMMFIPSEEDAINHAMLLGNGAFQVPSDANFAQDGPNVTMAPAWSSQPGVGDATGWDTIDPSLLYVSGA